MRTYMRVEVMSMTQMFDLDVIAETSLARGLGVRLGVRGEARGLGVRREG